MYLTEVCKRQPDHTLTSLGLFIKKQLAINFVDGQMATIDTLDDNEPWKVRGGRRSRGPYELRSVGFDDDR